jgi:hypothetical protein
MMNERIEKLMVNASSGACYDGNEPVLFGTEIEKFAEMIVKDCVKVIDDSQPWYKDYRDQIQKGMRDYCSDRVKDHFGVEE